MKKHVVAPEYSTELPREVFTSVKIKATNEVLIRDADQNYVEFHIRGVEIPPFEGVIFNEEYIEHLRQHNISPFAINMLYDSIHEVILEAQAVEALYRASKSR